MTGNRRHITFDVVAVNLSVLSRSWLVNHDHTNTVSYMEQK